MRIFVQDKTVDTVVARVLLAVCMHAAARDNGYICTFAHIKIVVYKIVHRAVGHAGRDIHGLALGSGEDMDINAGLIRFGSNPDVFGGLPPGALPVLADVVCRVLRHAHPVRNRFEQPLCDLVHLFCAPSSGHPHAFSGSPSSCGRISSRLPCADTCPFAMTTISSAISKMRR